VAAALAVAGWMAARGEPTAAAQNHIVLGLLLAMFAIIPGEASAPPLPWRSDDRPRARSVSEEPPSERRLRRRSPSGGGSGEEAVEAPSHHD
jgi:hypothetical protein